MPSSEPGLPEAPSSSVQQLSTRRGRSRAVVLAVSIAAVLVAVLLVRPVWHTFSDPLDLYTLRLPPGWTAQGGLGPGGTLTDPYGTEALTQDSFQFTDRVEGTGSADVWIVATQIKTAFDHHSFCGPPPYTNGLFRIYPASYQGFPDSWLFTTGNATFQIDVTIPGVVEPPHTTPIQLTPQPTATPLPATWVLTDLTDVKGIVDSFQPSDPNPLDC